MGGMSLRVFAVTWLMVAALLGGASAQSIGTKPSERVVTKAAFVVEEFFQDPQFAPMRATVNDAYGVIVVPELLQGGFFIGADYGVGVLVLRNLQTLGWSEPSFVRVAGGSFGLQFGGKTSDVIITLMNPGAVNEVLSRKVTLGGQAGLAVGPVGADIGAATTTNLGRDVYVFARSKGLFGGFAIDGSVVWTSDKWNAEYYDRPVTPYQIVKDLEVQNPVSAPLQSALARLSTTPLPNTASGSQ